jgi:hypothetical protein
MSSGILQKYYTHTKEGKNKDYRMVINFSDLTLECHWGPIGGTKQVDRYKMETMKELTNLINEKHLRRLDHGYTDTTSSLKDLGVEVPIDFASDIADLVAAERLGA